MIELGQELGYVKEMGQTCGASNGTSLMTPHRLGSWHACSGRWQHWCVRFSWLLTSRRVRPLWPQGTGRVWRRSIHWNRWGNPLSNSVQPAHPYILHTQICVFGVVQHFYTKRNSQGMSGQVDMMSISLNIRQSIRFTVETRNRIFGSICTFPRHAVPATRRQVLV